MRRKPRILVVGSFVMDVIATTQRLPQAGQAVYGESFHMAAGGKGANQAVQCARLGADVTMMGCVGDDLFGSKLLEAPALDGVDVSHARIRPGISSGVGHITIEIIGNTAQNRIVVIPGANQAMELEDIAWIQDEIGSYDMVLLQLEVPLEINRTIAHWAKDAQVPVMLNPAPATELDDALVSLVTYIAPNEQEAAVESGVPLRVDENGPNMEDLTMIFAALSERGADNIIVTLGSNGCALGQNGSICRMDCVRMDQVVDPTGAGDSFVGAFCVGLTVGLTRQQAIDFASHTAALTVSRMGAMPSLPTLDEVCRLLRERSYRGFDFAMLDGLK